MGVIWKTYNIYHNTRRLGSLTVYIDFNSPFQHTLVIQQPGTHAYNTPTYNLSFLSQLDVSTLPGKQTKECRADFYFATFTLVFSASAVIWQGAVLAYSSHTLNA